MCVGCVYVSVYVNICVLGGKDLRSCERVCGCGWGSLGDRTGKQPESQEGTTFLFLFFSFTYCGTNK